MNINEINNTLNIIGINTIEKDTGKFRNLDDILSDLSDKWINAIQNKG